ncbi:THO complex subunit 2-like isoform X2 [Ornithodoros turicata]|uniref:THO complex subunit 2-like isoform X2 n=1 Tax=Ornithodoros turicata TaxID=34597 RepID=UPI00313A1776
MAGRPVSLEICKSWERSGKSDFLKLCRTAAANMQPTKAVPHMAAPGWSCKTKEDKYKKLQVLLHDICCHVLEDKLKVEQVIPALAEVVVINQQVPSMLADVIFLLDMDTQAVENRDHRERYLWLIGGCAKIIPESLLKERLDTETLGDAGIIKNSRVALTKFVKIKTRLFYKQNKYNLFREESEGYAKLMTELSQEITSRISPDYMIEVMRSLIGCFNLDPNRVLDVVLEAFECRLELEDFFVGLLRKFLCNATTISQVLGFKFTFYQGGGDESTPASLYKLAALLIKNRLISLEDLYSLLVPEDSAIVSMHKKDVSAAKTFARRANILVVSSDKLDEKKDEDKDDDLAPEDNQKLGLCAALIEVGDWENASALISHLPEYYAVTQPNIARKLCHLVHVLIDPLYKKHSGLPQGFRRSYSSKGLSPPVETFADFQSRVLPMILALGPLLHLDPVLMVKIVRLARSYLQQKQSEQGRAKDLRFDFLTLIGDSLLPSLSLLDCNCCVADEVWSLLRFYPYQQRYRLYSQWKNETYLSHPLLIRMKAESLKKIKYIMKRLSKENVKPSGRQIGKLSHSNPCFLFDYILSQIQTWDNLIGPVVDSLKYLTLLSYDVLAYCIIEALCNPEKDRMKHDGTTISQWLQSLANFCGAVFKKYSIELTGLLQLVANQLKAEKSLDLLVLKEIVQKMTGIESTEETTQEQLEAMCGGELLKAEGGYFHQLRNTKKSSQRLKEALLEQDLALPLCLLMAQQKNCILYREQEASHLKLVGKLYDQCQDTLVQFGSFLSSSLSMEEYAGRLPPIGRLLSQYHVQADVAFFLARPMFGHAVAIKFDEIRKRDKGFKNLTDPQKVQKYVEAVDSVMTQVVDSVRPLHPLKTWEDLSPQFYVTFWSLSMYDLHVPSSSYDREIKKLKQQVAQIEDNKDMVPSKRKKERDRCEALMEKLQDEERKQQDHCSRILARLRNEKDSWFHSRSAKNETITQFLQQCVFPRCTFTALDALYCAKFVHLIHILKTPNFSTLICYDKIFCDITYTVTACTENEANRYGRFLCAMLETVMRWHSDKVIFDKECANFPGFMTKFRGASQSSDIATDHVDYENYRHVCHKWHFKITKALVICLESGDYVQIRNSLIILTKVLPHFPVMTNLGQALERRIEKIRSDEKDKRPDLFALATGYSGQLKTKKSELIPEHEFHLKDSKESRAPIAQTKTDHIMTTSTRSSGLSSSTTSSKSQPPAVLSGKSNGPARVIVCNVTQKCAVLPTTFRPVDGPKEKKTEAKSELATPNPPPTQSKGSSGGSSSSSAAAAKTTSTTSSSSSGSSRRETRGTSSKDTPPTDTHEKSSSSSAAVLQSGSSSSGGGGGSGDRKGSSSGSQDPPESNSSRRESDRRRPPPDDDTVPSHKSSSEHWADGVDDHKRRRTESTKSPKVSDERIAEEKERSTESHGASREKWAHPKDSHESPTPPSDKSKPKKTSRKRDHSEEGILESKRKKDDDTASAKGSSKRNGEESKEKDRYRREESSPKLRERRADRDDKKHHRSGSSSSTSSSASSKKRSSF